MSATASPSRPPFEARGVPPLGGFNLTFLAIEIRRLLRNRRTVIVTLVVPVVLFLLFKSNRRAVALGGVEVTAATTMIGIAVYGAMLAATSGGAMVSIERALGWSRQLRLTPLRPAAYIAIKLDHRDAAGPGVGGGRVRHRRHRRGADGARDVGR